MKSAIDLKKIRDAYDRYTRGAEKKALNTRIIENNRWYKQQYTEFSSREDNEKRKDGNRAPQAKSGYIFSAIAHKHADAMDNYPDINILPREARDEEEAKRLSGVLPCVLDLAGFRETYSKNWWYKLKNGTACYGVFWNPGLLGGLGDIEIKKIDLLNLAWQPNISELSDSKYVFYSYYMDKAQFALRYGKDKLEEADNGLEMETYSGKTPDIEDEAVLVVDCYYKKAIGGKTQLHLVKFSGEHILEQTEGKEGYENGFYDHGEYPFVFDVMYPNEDSPAGFGVVDVVKNPQAYIDKLDALLSENAIINGKTRYFISDGSGVNEEEFLDMDKVLVHVAGSLDERHIRLMEGKPLPNQIVEQRLQKIQELKEVIGNRDFQQGGTTGGVTSGNALTILQQAGDKVSRDVIENSYRAYRKICELAIELMRQFYNIERNFRIAGEDGEQEFAAYSNSYIAQAESGATEGTEHSFYRPEFDVVLSVQRSNPFTKEQQNQTILSLWQMGFFNPQALDMSLLALSAMQFDGKEKLVQLLKEKKDEMAMQTQAQAMQKASVQAPDTGLPQAEGELVEIPLG